MANWCSNELAWRVADEDPQVHGGSGSMMAFPVQRAWPDARLGPIGGTPEILKEASAASWCCELGQRTDPLRPRGRAGRLHA